MSDCTACGAPVAAEAAVAFADGYRHRAGDCFGPYEKHTMPNGSVVYYHDGNHAYHSSIEWKGGKWVGKGKHGDLPSPSHIGKFVDPSADNLLDWAARKTCEGIYLMDDHSYNSGDELYGLLREAKLTWRDLRSSAGDEGTFVHDAFEAGLRGVATDIADAPSDRARAHLLAVDRFIAAHQDRIEVLQTEAVVLSRNYGFAGRFDARVLLDGVPTLLDLKTSKYVGRSYHVQLAGYKLAIRESGYGDCEQSFLLQTRDDGTYRLWPVRAEEADFLHALALWRAGKRIDRLSARDYREAA